MKKGLLVSTGIYSCTAKSAPELQRVCTGLDSPPPVQFSCRRERKGCCSTAVSSPSEEKAGRGERAGYCSRVRCGNTWRTKHTNGGFQAHRTTLKEVYGGGTLVVDYDDCVLCCSVHGYISKGYRVVCIVPAEDSEDSGKRPGIRVVRSTAEPAIAAVLERKGSLELQQHHQRTVSAGRQLTV